MALARGVPAFVRALVAMDFVAVPAGTAAPQALVLRGPDHDADLAAGDSFDTVLGDALEARVAPGNRKRIPYSSVSGMLSGHLFTRDPAVLALALHGQGCMGVELHALCFCAVCVCACGVNLNSTLYE